jgi:hypothetical protein
MRKHGEPDIESRGCRTGGDKTTDTIEQISGLLHEAGETHHRVFRIVDGADDDWASCADRVELKQPGKGGTQTAVNPHGRLGTAAMPSLSACEKTVSAISAGASRTPPA